VSSSSKRVTVGYRYFLGAHMGLVHGPVDSLNRIRVADKVVWVGTTDWFGAASFEIEQPEIFGGKGAEGGIEGTFIFANGGPNQQANAYLQDNLGTPIPAFRGVSCGILRQMYVSANNPYLKPWAFYLTRTNVTTGGQTQWYVEKAAIPTTCGFGGVAEYDYEVLSPPGFDFGNNPFWTPPEGTSSVEVFIVGQGGAGMGEGGNVASGSAGGGGEVKLIKNYPVTGPVEYYTMGGFNNTGESDRTHFGSIVAKGGGFGNNSSGWATYTGYTGGSGTGRRTGSGAYLTTSPKTGTGETVGGAAYANSGEQYIASGGGASIAGNGGKAEVNSPGKGADGVFFGVDKSTGESKIYTVPLLLAALSIGRDIEPAIPGHGGAGLGFPYGWFGGGGGGCGRTPGVDQTDQGDYAPGGLGGGGSGVNGAGAPLTGGGGGGRNIQSFNIEHRGGSGFLAVRYSAGFSVESFDMNPAHIIRECLTDKEWGMGYSEADIDDASFIAAADTLFDEQMGISILWQRENTIEAFVQDIIRHIDAALYVDRRTGKFVLKLIRDDYDPNALITLTPDNIERVENYKRPAFGDLVNSVTVIYDDCDDGRVLEVPE
jgi:hypothetical protein